MHPKHSFIFGRWKNESATPKNSALIVRAVMGRKWDNRANYDKSMKLGILTKFDL